MISPDILAFKGLTPHERKIVEMRIRDGLRANIIAKRLGITSGCVSAALCSAKKRFTGRRPAAVTVRVTNTRRPVMDADWFPRMVAYVRFLECAEDPTHQRRFLNGIELVWGEEWRIKVEEAAQT